jgi:hypothetical protein
MAFSRGTTAEKTEHVSTGGFQIGAKENGSFAADITTSEFVVSHVG